MSNTARRQAGVFLRNASVVLFACAAFHALAEGRRDHAERTSALRGQRGIDASAFASDARVSAEVRERAWLARAVRRSTLGYGDVAPQVIDYRDDEPSRLRRVGLLIGALPLPHVSGAVAAGHLPCAVDNPDCCTFDIDCDDSDPCTTDRCEISPQGPLGAGSCSHLQVTPGLAGGCDDGIFCNGLESCDASGVCSTGLLPTCCVGNAESLGETCSEDLARCSVESSVFGRRCTVDSECPGGRCDHCVFDCLLDIDCDDGFACNGVEHCAGGICEPGDPPCGFGGNCFEKQCLGSLLTRACVNDADCGANETCGSRMCTGSNGGVCSVDADCDPFQSCVPAFVCRLGRCCPPNASPDDCQPSTLDNCLAVGGQWYAGEGGEASGTIGECGGRRAVIGAQQIGCPVYSSGIVQASTAAPESPQLVGPVSLSPKPAPAPGGPGVPLQRLGDDYQVEGATHIALEAVRIVGGMLEPDAVFVEVWDDDGNFIEDFLFRPSRTVGVNLLELSPPLTIPPRGRISVRNKVEFAANAKFVWASATASDTGVNDPDKLFVNDDPHFSIASSDMMGAAPAVLAFELAGRSVGSPVGGCCHSNSSACTNELQWVCETSGRCVASRCVGGVSDGGGCADDDECGGVFLGLGSLCATCINGPEPGLPCEACQGGTEPGDFPCINDPDCDARGLGGTCLPNDALCNSGLGTCSNDSAAFCAGDADCPSRPSVCGNSDQLCTVDFDCPAGGICGGSGSCSPGACVVAETCSVGACCLADGSCAAGVAETDCTGVFQGNGSTCDPNCCPAPLSTGRDHCADVVIGPENTIPVLAPTDPRIVLTFTGDNSAATSTAEDPDSCFGEARDLDADRGWWEAFALTDSCTRVRIDLCCSVPVHFANWPWLATDCNCGGIANAKLDANFPNLSEAERGEPFCNEDNLWVSMGLLPAGNYYYSIRSALSGTLGPYTMHVVAEACPEAACCLPNGECVTVNQLECDAGGGFFLAPPNKFPAATACVSDPPTCGIGACCTAPGECVDEDLGNPVARSDCDFFGGFFIGGMKCRGGVCVQDQRFSCSTRQDCLDGGAGCPALGSCCVAPGGDARALEQPNPCPICELESPGQCQSEAVSSELAAISELSLGTGIVHADDFIPNAGLQAVDQLCVWGAYSSADPNEPGADCANNITSDDFRVRIYRDNGFNLPGALIGESSATATRAVVDNGGLGVSNEQWVFQLTLDTPITGLIPGEVQWLEVANDLPPEARCFWSWSLISSASSQGNRHMAGTSVTIGYVPGSERRSDAAWCLPGAVSTPPTPVRASCGCAGDCFGETADDAQANNHSFQIDAVDVNNVPRECSEFVCPLDGTPDNDDFENAREVGVGFFTYETFCATTDGLTSEPSELGDAAVTLDVWYKFTAAQDCELTVSQCASGTADTSGFDAILGVYTDGTETCPDPRTQAVADVTRVSQNGAVLSDEECCGQDRCGGPGLIRVPALAGQCFTIRAAAFNGQGNERGRGVIDITCGTAICGDGLVNSPGEECDGNDLGGCLGGSCLPPGDPAGECTCCTAVCGNLIIECGEECEGFDDTACPGLCGVDCRCIATCGNGVAETTEDCDGSDDALCPGRCEGDCTCPPKFCGNNFNDPGEECDGTDNGRCSDGVCRPPGDPAGECTCACVACSVSVAPTLPEFFVPRSRFIAVVIPDVPDAGLFALEVELTSLHHPVDPIPVDSPDFSALEGKTRYVQLIRNADGTVITDCLDSAAFQTTYKCATLGCEREVVDWVSLFGGATLYITGDAIVPNSVYRLRREGHDFDCVADYVEVVTARWGGTQGDAIVTVTDVVNVVDRVKDLFGAIPESAALLHPAVPTPHSSSPSVLDVTLTVDALKLLPYPYPISSCP